MRELPPKKIKKAKLLKIVLTAWADDDSQEALDKINIEVSGVTDWTTVSITTIDEE